MATYNGNNFANTYNDTLGGNDSISGNGGNDTLNGGAGNDTIFGGSGTDSILGGDNNDIIDGGSGGDSLAGGNGDDTFNLTGTFGADTIAGGANGTTGDTISAASQTAGVTVSFTGTDAGTISNGTSTASFSQVENYTLTGQADTMDASSATGGLNIASGAGVDTVTGGSGNDTIDGGSGGDSLTGGNGNDVLTGNGGSNIGTGQVNWVSLGDGTSVTGGATLDSGGVRTTISYSDDGAGQIAEADNDMPIYVAGSETFDANSALYLQGSGAGANSTVTMDFSATPGGSSDGTVSNVTFRIEDVDQQAWQDIVTVLAYDADGNLITVNLTPASTGAGADTVSDNTITAGNESNEPNQANGSVLVSIAGPVAQIVVIYANGGTGNQYIFLSNVHYSTVLLDNDTLTGGAGNDSAYGGDGNDLISGGADNDLVDGGSGNDTLFFGEGQDQVFGGSGDDTIDDTASAQDTGASYVDAGAGNDRVWSGGGNDSLYGGDGNDLMSGEGDDDLMDGGDGDDSLDGSAGRDTITGGDGNDSLYGGDDNDVLSGGLGDDQLFGGAGDEYFAAEDGNDSLSGGTGNDTFDGGIGDTVDGGENSGDADVLDLSAWGWSLTNVIYGPTNESGTVQFLDSTGAVIGSMAFSNIEQVITCFTPGTLIRTPKGQVRVQDLQPGDLVMTRDHGAQPLRWIGRRDLGLADLIVRPQLRPVTIAQGALGQGLPARRMQVSPQHRMLIEGPRAEMLFGEAEVLVAATHLTVLPGVSQDLTPGVSYIHLMFDAHELIEADGAWSESFQPAERTLDPDQRAEIAALFPDMAQGFAHFPAARLSLKAHEARVLLAA